MKDLTIDVCAFDIPREATVYPDRAYTRWWTKSWFNNRQSGEPSVPIELWQAIKFILGRVDRDEWLDRYYPRQMQTCRDAINQTRDILLGNPITPKQ
ncbi:MAG: hypothetical protein LIO91_06140 [Bacteroidales bacterium]|nr:hypothetical protein [Bacteroidales bacterium]